MQHTGFPLKKTYIYASDNLPKILILQFEPVCANPYLAYCKVFCGYEYLLKQHGRRTLS